MARETGLEPATSGVTGPVKVVEDQRTFPLRDDAKVLQEGLKWERANQQNASPGNRTPRAAGSPIPRAGRNSPRALPAALAHAMGNTLAASNALFATYVPVNAATIRQVAEARKIGRAKLR